MRPHIGTLRIVSSERRPRKARRPCLMKEENIQRVLVDHLNQRAQSGIVFFHVPNGGKRNIGEAVRFKRMGVLPGIPDLMLLRDGKLYALELKTEQGRLSDEQRAAIGALSAAGATVATAYGLDHALTILDEWGMFQK